jgi:hypothetical protein
METHKRHLSIDPHQFIKHSNVHNKRKDWLYLVDGEHLAIALLHLLELSQEVPARKQARRHRQKPAPEKQ